MLILNKKMIVSVYNLDAAEKDSPVCKLPVGEHKIGRGALLKCDDLRVSRQHAVINIETEQATIVATHQNPCFYQSANSKTIVVLERDSPLKICDGDKFGLIPDQFWYKLKISHDNEANGNIVQENGTSHVGTSQDEDSSDSVDLLQETYIHKRNHAADNEEIPCKIPKMDNTSDTVTIHESEVEEEKETQISSNANVEDVCISILPNEISSDSVDKGIHETDEITSKNLKINDTSVTVKTGENECEVEQEEKEDSKAVCISSSDLNDDCAGISNINQTSVDIRKNVNSDLKDVPSTSGNKSKIKEYRVRCKYGENCYRNNPLHKQSFCHPEDDDYESDPTDVRPQCIYGSNCYRKNKDHRLAYRHSRDAPNKTKLRKKKASKRQQDDDTTEDDYDFEDPFLDDSGDEYKEESWSEDSDTDWKDSENIDDDETASLQKEAKRFTRKK